MPLIHRCSPWSRRGKKAKRESNHLENVHWNGGDGGVGVGVILYILGGVQVSMHARCTSRVYPVFEFTFFTLSSGWVSENSKKKTESANFCRGNSCTCLFYLSWKWFFLLTHLSFDSFCRATFCPRSIYLYAGQMFVFSYLLSCLITYLTDVYWKTASFALMCCVFYIVWDRSDLPEYRGNKPPPLQ